MTPTLVGPIPLKKDLPPKNTLERLDYLCNRIKHHHEHVLSHEFQSLEDALAAGEFAAQAYPLWHRLRGSGKCNKTWTEWISNYIKRGARSISTYKYLHLNRHLLKDLPADQQSVRGAVRFLKGKKRTTPSNEVPVETELVLQVFEKHQVHNLTLEQFEAITNDVLKEKHFRRHLKLYQRSK
jgi:hypothetical protein